MSVRELRLAAVLMPAALVLHEGTYALHGGGSLAGAHGYLELALPVIVALAASLALASVLLPALGRPGDVPSPRAPFALAGALLAIFGVQELVEASLLGGGVEGLLASASVAWLAPPLALLLGLLAGGVMISLERTGELLARPARRRTAPQRGLSATALPPDPVLAAAACAGLSFGFARRPPPLAP